MKYLAESKTAKVFLMLGATTIHFVAQHFLDPMAANLIFAVAMIGAGKVAQFSGKVFWSVCFVNVFVATLCALPPSIVPF